MQPVVNLSQIGTAVAPGAGQLLTRLSEQLLRAQLLVDKSAATLAPLAFGLAARGNADFTELFPPVAKPDSYRHYFAFAITYGVNAELLIGSHVALTAHFGVGWSLLKVLDPAEFEGSSPTFAFALDASLGMQTRF